MLAATLTLAALTFLLVLDDTPADENRQAIPVESDDRDTLSR
ncbi:hypothetical protein [Oleiharenicola lentus]|nr:hypothetical protein [Oleiharenicola lentus]